MAASAILLVDDAQDSWTSLSDVISYLDYPGSGAYDGPAAPELSRRYTSGRALLDFKSPGTDGVELDGRLSYFQPGTAGVRGTGCAAEAAVRAATQANIRQVMPRAAVTDRHKRGKGALMDALFLGRRYLDSSPGGSIP
jgi:response regulator RpfG family c-di-GMP phosphodiesterase